MRGARLRVRLSVLKFVPPSRTFATSKLEVGSDLQRRYNRSVLSHPDFLDIPERRLRGQFFIANYRRTWFERFRYTRWRIFILCAVVLFVYLLFCLSFAPVTRRLRILPIPYCIERMVGLTVHPYVRFWSSDDVPPDHLVAKWVTAITQKLLGAAAQFPSTESVIASGPWVIRVEDSPAVNCCYALGGRVVLSTGLIATLGAATNPVVPYLARRKQAHGRADGVQRPAVVEGSGIVSAGGTAHESASPSPRSGPRSSDRSVARAPDALPDEPHVVAVLSTQELELLADLRCTFFPLRGGPPLRLEGCRSSPSDDPVASVTANAYSIPSRWGLNSATAAAAAVAAAAAEGDGGGSAEGAEGSEVGWGRRSLGVAAAVTLGVPVSLVTAGASATAAAAGAVSSAALSMGEGVMSWYRAAVDAPAAVGGAVDGGGGTVARATKEVGGASPVELASSTAPPASCVPVEESIDVMPLVVAALAHEVAHGLLRHPAEKVSVTQLKGAVGHFVGHDIWTDAVATYGFLLPHSRRQEGEADEVAMWLLEALGIDCRYMPLAVIAAASASTDKEVEWLSTHPDAARRTKVATRKAVALRSALATRSCGCGVGIGV